MRRYFSQHREVFSELISLAWPAVLQGLLLTIVFLTDRILLGQYNTDGLGVMQICGPALWSLFHFVVHLISVLSHYWDVLKVVVIKNSWLHLKNCSFLSFFMGVLILFCSPWISDLFISWMGRETPELSEVASSYFFPLFLAAPFKLWRPVFLCFTITE